LEETDNLYPLLTLYAVGVTISYHLNPLCTAPSRRKAIVALDRFSREINRDDI